MIGVTTDKQSRSAKRQDSVGNGTERVFVLQTKAIYAGLNFAL